jgi:hypothetical protein
VSKEAIKTYTKKVFLREKPEKYVIWPHSASKGWIKRLVYDIPENAVTITKLPPSKSDIVSINREKAVPYQLNEKDVFEKIYSDNYWGSKESVSGPCSTLAATALLRQALPAALQELKISTLVDAPCGDLNWIRHLDYQFEIYIGVDIVFELIAKLRADKTLSNRHFQLNNIITDILPRADALLCRDCLVHLPFEMIKAVVTRWKLAGFRYVLVTTFPDHQDNKDCRIGGWRALNFCAAPFNWPAPKLLINEFPATLEWAYRDKCIGIWDLTAIATPCFSEA